MRALISKAMALPIPGKAMIGMLLAGGVYGLFAVLGMPQLGFMVGVAIAVLVFVLALFAFGMEKRDKKKAEGVEASIADSAAATPTGVNKVADRAKLDDLRRQFEGGVQTFKDHGKNLYEMPWYVVVGEPGSGKTEAVRHSGIGFPPGLTDQLQGTGGTVNMNWWFTDQAVVLDTAGRLMFEDVAPGETNEWREFLKLLRTCRPNCPINGMLLVIPADTLITDRPEEIEKKAGKISQQFEQIQRSLGVRFPVFVLITKSDLMNGFREFFEDITDPRLTAQMLGWSNPADLDEPFKPDRVEEHLDSIREHLLQRRFALLQDPVHSVDPKDRRIDQVDALYKFPEAITEIAPRLRRYLETIFVAGEWSQKPLFLRGIFFTSSMQTGSVLDADLADALGVSVESIADKNPFSGDRTFFLRDVFLDKVFKERGLVTRAANAGQVKRKRAMLLAGSAAAASLLLGAMIWYSYSQTQATIQKPRDLWVSVRDVVTGVAKTKTDESISDLEAVQEYMSPIIDDSVAGIRTLDVSGSFGSGNDRIDGGDSKKLTNLEVFDRAKRYYEENRSSTGLFSLVATLPGGGKDVFKRQLPTQRLVFEQLVLARAINITRDDMVDGGEDRPDGSIGWGAQDQGAGALAMLLSLEVDAIKGNGAPLTTEAFRDLIRFTVPELPAADGSSPVPPEDLEELAAYYEWLYPTDVPWPPPTLRAGSEIAIASIDRGVAGFNDYWRDPRGVGTLFGQLLALKEAGEALSSAEGRLAGMSGDLRGVETEADYQARKTAWIASYDAYNESFDAFIAAFAPIEGRFGLSDFVSTEIADAAYRAVWDSAQEAYEGLLMRFGEDESWAELDPEKEAENRLLEWRTQLSDAMIAAETSYLETANRLVASIRESTDGVTARHLAMDRGVRPYLMRKSIFQHARESLDRGVPDENDLKVRLDGIGDGLSSDTKPFADGATGPEAACVGVYEAVARHLRYSAISAEVTRLQDWDSLLDEGVVEPLPEIPLARLGTLRYTTRLLPANNVELRSSFDAIRERIGRTSESGQSYSLDGLNIEAAIARIEAGLESHFQEYQRFWTQDVPAALMVRADPNVSWREMRAELDTADRWDDLFDDLRTLMSDAIGNAASDPDADRDVRTLAAALAAEENDDRLRERIGVHLIPSWSGLNSDAARAGEALGRAAATPRVLMSRYFPLEPAFDDVGPEAVYWRSFTIAATEKIGDESAGAEDRAIRGVEADCKRFPITLSRAGGSGLSHARIEEIHGVLSGVDVLASDSEIVAGDRPFPDIRNDRIRDALNLIHGGSLMSDAARVGRLQRALRATTFLTENADKVSFTLAVQNLDFSDNIAAGTGGITYIQIADKLSAVGEMGGETLIEGREVLKSYTWRLPLQRGVQVKLTDMQQSAQNASLSGWDPLRAVLNDRDDFATGETVWPLPVAIGGGRTFWMGAVFSGGGASRLADLKQVWLQDSDW